MLVSIRVCLDQPLIAIRSPRRCHDHVRSPDTVIAFKGKPVCPMLHSWLAVRACASDYRTHICRLIHMQCHAAESCRLLRPCYGCAQDHTLRACTADQFMGPVLEYSGLFSTAMDGTALGGTSDHDHLMMTSRSSITASNDRGKPCFQ